MFKKKLLNIFSIIFFYLKVQSFWLIMSNNFIQMAVSVSSQSRPATIIILMTWVYFIIPLFCLTPKLPRFQQNSAKMPPSLQTLRKGSLNYCKEKKITDEAPFILCYIETYYDPKHHRLEYKKRKQLLNMVVYNFF